MKENYDLTSDVLEIVSGYYPAFASMIDDYQTEYKKGSIEICDPNLIVTKKGNIKINRMFFNDSTDIKKFQLVTAIFPCNPIVSIIEKANAEDKDFSILLCECIPNDGYQLYMSYQFSKLWHDYVYHIAKSTLKPDSVVDISYLSKVDTPIIYSKRKR